MTGTTTTASAPVAAAAERLAASLEALAAFAAFPAALAPSPAALAGPLQVEAVGGPVIVVLLGLLLQAATIPVALAIAYRLYVGYRGTGDRAMLALAVGLLFLTAVPQTVRFVLATTMPGLAVLRGLATTASELLGLGAMLYAIHGRPGGRRRVRRRHTPERSRGVLPFVPGVGSISLTGRLIVDLASGLTAIVGAYVAVLAYRGYRRNDSRPMAYLAAGIVLLTTVPFVVSYGAWLAFDPDDATVLVLTGACYLIGLVSVHYSLTRA